MDAPATAAVDRFCHQYIQLERDLDYPSGVVLQQQDVQDDLYRRLFAEGAMPRPPPLRYQLSVLKNLMSRIEGAIQDWDQYGVSDDLMTSLSTLLATPLPPEITAAQQKNYVSYHLSLLDPSALPAGEEAWFTFLESRNLISAFGTTGLRTWEAALHCGQYLCQNPALVQGKRVLELGAGTGYLSILCARFLGAAQTIASDGSDDVVASLPENFFVNGLQDSESISATELKWGHGLVGTEEEQWNGGRPVDLVLGADITYDQSVIPSLVATVDELFTLFPKAEVIIAATERNRDTYEAFLTVCQQRTFVVDEMDFPVPRRENQTGPFYNDQVPIRICKVKKTADNSQP